jgi:hypothetical protein
MRLGAAVADGIELSRRRHIVSGCRTFLTIVTGVTLQ